MKDSGVYHLVPESGIGGADDGAVHWPEAWEDGAIGKRGPCPDDDSDDEGWAGGCTWE